MRLPYVDELIIKKITDETVRWTAVRTGELDYVQRPPINIVRDEIKNPTPGVVTLLPQPVGNEWIYFNCTKAPFNDKRVRQAVAYCLDKEEIVKAAFWGMGETINNQPFLNRSRFYIPVKDREVDRKKAKQLLAEAGYPNGFDVKFLQYQYPKHLDLATAIIGQLKEIGVNGTINLIDRAPYAKMMKNGEYTISARGDSERMDPDDYYYMRFHSSEIGSNNWSGYVNKDLDSLVEKGRRIVKWEDRVPVYREVIEILKEDVPTFCISKSIIAVAFKDYVKGHEAGMATWFGYHQGGMKMVWLDK